MTPSELQPIESCDDDVCVDAQTPWALIRLRLSWWKMILLVAVVDMTIIIFGIHACFLDSPDMAGKCYGTLWDMFQNG